MNNTNSLAERSPIKILERGKWVKHSLFIIDGREVQGSRYFLPIDYTVVKDSPNERHVRVYCHFREILLIIKSGHKPYLEAQFADYLRLSYFNKEYKPYYTGKKYLCDSCPNCQAIIPEKILFCPNCNKVNI